MRILLYTLSLSLLLIIITSYYVITFLGNDIPKIVDLYRHVVQQQAPHWDTLGLELGLNQCTIENINANHQYHANRVQACCKAMLQKWLQSDLSATWGKLDDAIKNIKAANMVPTDKDGNCVFCI